jgi:hypothetical protein
MVAWIDELIAANVAGSRPVAEAGFVRLGDYLPDEVLQHVRVVKLAKTPFPPFEAMGLPEFALIAHIAAAGITYRDVCFLNESMATESTCSTGVHAPMAALGVRYLDVQGSLMRYGYARGPLEVTAFDMQARSIENAGADLLAGIEAGSLEAGREADTLETAGHMAAYNTEHGRVCGTRGLRAR